MGRNEGEESLRSCSRYDVPKWRTDEDKYFVRIHGWKGFLWGDGSLPQYDIDYSFSRSSLVSTALFLLFALSGCTGVGNRHEARHPVSSKALADETSPWELEIGCVTNRITNGVSYEKAELPAFAGKTLFVPTNAHVETRSEVGAVYVYVAKKLAYYGHPGRDVHIRNERECVGLALKEGSDSVHLGTWGEWDSQIEGGLFIYLLVSVPAGTKWEVGDKLSGQESVAVDDDIERHYNELRNPETKRGYCSSRRIPAEGWKNIETVRDSDRRGKEALTPKPS